MVECLVLFESYKNMTLIISKKDFLRGSLFCFAVSVFLVGYTYNGPQVDVSQVLLSTTKGLLPRAMPIDTDTIIQPIDTLLPPTDTVLPPLTVVGVGDIMLGTNYPSKVFLPPNDGKNLLTDVLDILQNADVTFGNLEGTLFDTGGKPKTCKDSTICYVFRSPAKYVDRYVEAGFDLLSIANNHSGDFGAEGRLQTKAVLKAAGIGFAGLTLTDETCIFVKDSVRYGLCAFAPNSGTCDIRNLAKAKQIVAQLSLECDIVIASFHGGAEGATRQHVPRAVEEFYGENRGDVYAFAHAVVDAGADIVFGHGPHVTRAVELYQDRFIAYSMGNFCTYGRFSLAGPAGYAPIISLQIDRTGAFLGGEIIPIYQQKTHGPKIDPQRRAIKAIQTLTKTDFPETPLQISGTGKMTKQVAVSSGQ